MITTLVITLLRLPGKIYRQLKKIFIALFIPKDKQPVSKTTSGAKNNKR